MNISAQLLPRMSAEPSTLEIKFSMCQPPPSLPTYTCLFLLAGLFWLGLAWFGLVPCRGWKDGGYLPICCYPPGWESGEN
jgi:hypothetical protein